MSLLESAFELSVVISAVDKFTAPYKKTAESMKYAQKDIDMLTKSMKNIGKSSEDIDKMTGSLDRLAKNKAWANLAKDLKAAGMAQKDIDDLAKGFDKLVSQQNKLKKFTDEFERYKKLALTGAGITVAGIGMGKGIEQAFESILQPAMEFEDVMNDVKIAAFGKDLIDKSKAEEVKRVVNDLTIGFEKLGVATKFSDTSTAQAALGMLRGGLDRNFLLGTKGANGQYNYSGLTAAMYSAQLGKVDPGVAGDFIAKQKAAFNLGPDKVLDAVNYYTKVSAASTMDFKDLISGMLTASGVAGQLYMSPEDTALLVASTGTYTKDGGSAGTFTKDFLDRLMPHSNKQKEAMESLGWIQNDKSIFFDDSGKIKGADFLQKTLQDTKKKFAPNEFQALMSKVFLEQGKNTALALATEGDVFGDIKGNVGNQLDMYQQVQIQMEGTKNLLDTVKETLKIVKKLFGEPFLESLSAQLKRLNDFLGNNVAAWAKAHPELIKYIGYGAAITAILVTVGGALLSITGLLGMASSGFALLSAARLGPIALGVMGIVAALALLGPNVKDIGKWFHENWDDIKPFVVGLGLAWGTYAATLGVVRTATTVATVAQWAWNVAMNANPIGLIITGIGLLVGAGIWLANNWDMVRTKAGLLWNILKDNPFFYLATGPVALLIRAGVELYQNWDILRDKGKAVWIDIENSFIKGVNTAIGAWNKLMDLVGNDSLKGTTLDYVPKPGTPQPVMKLPVQGPANPNPFAQYGVKGKGGEPLFHGSFAKGLDWVPFDGFRAILHKGERVLTASENKEYSSGLPLRTAGGGDTHINIYPHPGQNVNEIADEVERRLARRQRGMMMNTGTSLRHTV